MKLTSKEQPLDFLRGREPETRYQELTAEIDKKLRDELFAPKTITAEEQSAINAQNEEEEDDLALLEEDL